MIKHIPNYIKANVVFLLLFLSINSDAQIYLSGVVSDKLTSVGVPGHTVFISTDTTNQQVYFYASTIQTDGQGAFVDTVSPPVGVLIKFYISTFDCNQVLHKDSIYSVFPMPINIGICTNGINMCLADFVAYPDTSNSQQIHFYNISSSNITSSMWDFGDGNYSSQHHPTHLYNYGIYQVCLSVGDSVSGCSHTYCDSLKVSPVMNCDNSIIFHKLSSKKFSFTGSVNGLYPTLYSWDFGDGSFANGKTVIHEYLQPGFNTVSLVSTSMHPQTMDTCMSSSYTLVHATGNPTAGVWGQVFADSLEIDYAKVYLYSFDEINLELNLIDSANIINNDTIGLGSYYEFSGLEYGKYITYLKLLPNSIYSQSFAPAYSGNTIYWNDSYIFDLDQVSTAVPINLTHLFSLNGSSSISGYAYEGSKASSGDPKIDIPIYLLDENNAVIDFAFTEGDGSYSFDNLISQNYSIYSDVINHEIYPARVEISSNNQHIDNINIYISQNTVTSIVSEKEYNFKVFPKPANQYINVHFASEKLSNIEFRIVNILGQSLLYSKLNNDEKNPKFKIDISTLTNGIYFLQFTIGHNYSHVEKIIISK